MIKKLLLPKGFTLVELLVVVSIISILSTIGFVILTDTQKKSRDAKRKTDLAQIKTYLELYYNDNHKYPQAGAACNYGSNCYVFSNSGAEPWIAGLSTYSTRLPVDPINTAATPPGSPPFTTSSEVYSYSYGNVSSDGQDYDLTARLENTSDPERCALKNWKFGVATPPNYTGKVSWCGSYPNQLYEVGPHR